MPDIFLATLGQRPEAITIALDVLLDRYSVGTVVIVHTNPTLSPISKAYSTLRAAMKREYPQLKVHWEEIRHTDGGVLVDLDDEYTSAAYFRGIYNVLMNYREQGTLHLLVAGGRKVMSIYAMLAATLAFRGRDHLWTVHSPPELIEQEGIYRIPPAMRDRVHLVRLPMRAIRTWTGIRLDDPGDFVRQQRDVRSDFLSRLTDEERIVALMLEQHPHASNTELGDYLSKADRTVENQLRAVYGKMFAFLDIPVQSRHKRRVLLDLLRGEM
jgi:CRISPR-associated Csx14 family protein